MNTLVTPTPDTATSYDGTPLHYVGPVWIQDLATQIHPLLSAPPLTLRVQMPAVSFTTLFEWVSFVSMLDVLLALPTLTELGIDFVSHPQHDLLPRNDLIRYSSYPAQDRPASYDFSDRAYSFHGFIESLAVAGQERGIRQTKTSIVSRT